MRLAAVVILLGACANNPGMPHYWHSMPKPLEPVGPPRSAATVAMKTKPLPWWTLTNNENFVLHLATSPADEGPIHGRRMGAVRSRNIELSNDVFEAVRSAWGDLDASKTPTRSAGEVAHDAISEARAELRAHAADAGAGLVADVRCFAERSPPRDSYPGPSHLWCEGTAFATDAPAATDAPPAAPPAPITDEAASMIAAPSGELDPAAPRDQQVPLQPTRFTLVADAGVGMLGAKPIVSSTLGIRYRPIELGFYIVDLQRETVGPRDGGMVGLGLTAMGRKAIKPHSQADAIFGGSAVAAFQNGATNPDFDGLYQGFVGMAYQSRWNLFHGQPWVQLRAGGATGTALKNKPVPLVELHFGLATPERR